MELLKISNLNKNFGGLTVTKDLTMHINKGQIFGIIGPNGAGKSSLFNQISGYIKPDSGSIFYKGEDITGLPPHVLSKKGIGRTFQIVKPFKSETVLYNVTVGAFNITNNRKEAIQRAEEVLKLVGLYHKKDVLAKNLTIVDLKRLEIAKAMATNPDLLLLDEVLAGLTPSEVDEATKLIEKIRDNGVTILMIEHVMQAVMALCERVVVISYGIPIAEGTPEEVTKNPEVITAYLGADEDE
ncbi:ABC transporter ATP-binding protein [Tepidibacillus sp. HK-1]|uniref:ABC transporter ATP-binding protein n=1 Tax=Tepidibacillus sp. HK-1 TaxID=1883407 RepID=UPI0008533A85|nr:ABC transporter ATP-binding protein [Tepidibacillus sp. HK-1]GBF12567.1 lipopolysaccharide export system ATP-binding protein LptB [Tepidibacillus sp. HK-1]